MRLIQYSYFTNREMKLRKPRYRLSGKVTTTFHFDTTKYRDEKNNYYNVIGDYLRDGGIEHFKLTILKVGTIQ